MTYSECVSVSLVIYHAMCMCPIILVLSSVACLALPYFSILSHNWHYFQKKGTEHEMCVLIFSKTFVCSISHSRRTEGNITVNVHRSACKIPVILVRFFWNLNFCNRFAKIFKHKIWRKPIRWEHSCSMWTDGHDEANNHFVQFCKPA
jgi:hypothetical protein